MAVRTVQPEQGSSAVAGWDQNAIEGARVGSQALSIRVESLSTIVNVWSKTGQAPNITSDAFFSA